MFKFNQRYYSQRALERNRPRPIEDQIKILEKMLGLSGAAAMLFYEIHVRIMNGVAPVGAEGWFAFPSVNALAKRFFPDVDIKEWHWRATTLVLATIASSRRLVIPQFDFLPNRFRLNARTACALDILVEQQKDSDILIAGGQFGQRYHAIATRGVSRSMSGPEFAAHTIAVGSMLLTHPERFGRHNDTWLSIPGDELCYDVNGPAEAYPLFIGNSTVEFDLWGNGDQPDARFGSVSLFLPNNDLRNKRILDR